MTNPPYRPQRTAFYHRLFGDLSHRVLDAVVVGAVVGWFAFANLRWMFDGIAPSTTDLFVTGAFLLILGALYIDRRSSGSRNSANRYEALSRQLEDVMASMADPLLVISPEGTLQRVNRATLDLLGYTEEEMIGVSLSHFLMQSGGNQTMLGVLNTQERLRITRTFRARNGRLIPMSVTYTPIAAIDGSLYAVLCVAQSLSEIEAIRAKLHITNQRYNAAITSSRLGVFEYDPANNALVVDSNLKLLLTGQAAAIHTLDDALAYIPMEDHGALKIALNAVLTGKTPQLELEIRARSADRGLRWLLVRGAFNPQEGRLFGTLMDVTDRKVAEDRLNNRDSIMRAVAHASEVFLHAAEWDQHLEPMLAELGHAANVSRVYVFKNHLAPDGTTQLSSQIAEWCATDVVPQIGNPNLQNLDMHSAGFERWLHILGANEVLHGVIDGFPERERDFLRAQGIQSILIAPIQVNNTWWGYIGFDECQLPMVWQDSMIDALKVAADILGAAIFRSEADRELEAGREFILNIMTNLGQGVAVVDGKGRLVYVNPAYAQMIGLPREKVEGRQYAEFTPPDDHTYAPGQPAPIGSYITRLYTVEGQSIEVLVTSVQRVIDGKPDGAYCVVADITERRRMEEQRFELLLEKERMRLMSGFIRDMSHEFRTPLSIIQTSLYLLRRKPDHPQASNRLDTIGAQANRLNRLVDDLMLMMELEQAEIVPRALSLNTLATHVIAQNAAKAEAKHQTVSLEQPDGDVLVTGEEGYLARAAMMLVDNAIEFTPEGGRITLCVQRDPRYALLRVTDTGIGIPADELENIFEHMYKVDKARNTERGGLGLGLSIVRRIAALHHGEITVESTPGKGSTFVLKIPHPEPYGAAKTVQQTLTQEISAVVITATDEVGRVETE